MSKDELFIVKQKNFASFNFRKTMKLSGENNLALNSFVFAA